LPDAFIAVHDRWNRDNLGDSRYIWLPIEFTDDDGLRLRWHDEWDLSFLANQEIVRR